jgi:hypothetical protein
MSTVLARCHTGGRDAFAACAKQSPQEHFGRVSAPSLSDQHMALVADMTPEQFKSVQAALCGAIVGMTGDMSATCSIKSVTANNRRRRSLQQVGAQASACSTHMASIAIHPSFQ